jgi:hypothetical protein
MTYNACFAPADSLGIGKHKSSKMARFVLKCNKEDYPSACFAAGLRRQKMLRCAVVVVQQKMVR